MATIIDKLEIGDHVINQPFLYQTEYVSIPARNYKIRIDIAPLVNSDLCFLEYVFIIVDDCPKSIHMLPRVNMYDLHSRRDYAYFNKVYPLECENLYDIETNALLKSMVRTDMKDVLFIPFKMMKNGSLIDVRTIDILDFDFSSNTEQSARYRTISIFIKLSDKNSEKIDKLNYSNI